MMHTCNCVKFLDLSRSLNQQERAFSKIHWNCWAILRFNCCSVVCWTQQDRSAMKQVGIHVQSCSNNGGKKSWSKNLDWSGVHLMQEVKATSCHTQDIRQKLWQGLHIEEEVHHSCENHYATSFQICSPLRTFDGDIGISPDPDWLWAFQSNCVLLPPPLPGIICIWQFMCCWGMATEVGCPFSCLWPILKLSQASAEGNPHVDHVHFHAELM